jgi:hypothetical protein
MCVSDDRFEIPKPAAHHCTKGETDLRHTDEGKLSVPPPPVFKITVDAETLLPDWTQSSFLLAKGILTHR